MMEKIEILGVKISRVDFNQALEFIEKLLPDGKKHLVTTPYAESVVVAYKDEEFRMIINQSDLAVPDGGSLLVAAEYLSYDFPKNKILRFFSAIILGLWVGLKLSLAPKTFKSLKERVSGTDLVVSLCEISSQLGKKVYFLGGQGSEAAEAAQKLSIINYQLSIRTHEGPRELSKATVAETSDMINYINSFAPDFLFIAFRPVDAEKWLSCHMKEINAKVFMAVGGAFNMICGRKKRAPKIFQRLNLEWFWRLLIEPSRLSRIFNAVIIFPWLVFREKFRGNN